MVKKEELAKLEEGLAKPENPFVDMNAVRFMVTHVNQPPVERRRGKAFVASAGSVLLAALVGVLAVCFAFRRAPEVIQLPPVFVEKPAPPPPVAIPEPPKVVVVREMVHEAEPVKEAPAVVPPPRAEDPKPAVFELAGVWKRKGEFAMFRLRRSGTALQGEYVPVGNRSPAQLFNGKIEGNVAWASARLERIWDYQFEFKVPDEIEVTYRLNLSEAVADMAKIKARNAYEAGVIRQQRQRQINELTGVVKTLGIFERVAD